MAPRHLEPRRRMDPGSRSLADVRLLSSSWRRDITGLKARLVHLEVTGGEVMLGITTEAGQPPSQLAR